MSEIRFAIPHDLSGWSYLARLISQLGLDTKKYTCIEEGIKNGERIFLWPKELTHSEKEALRSSDIDKNIKIFLSHNHLPVDYKSAKPCFLKTFYGEMHLGLDIFLLESEFETYETWQAVLKLSDPTEIECSVIKYQFSEKAEAISFPIDWMGYKFHDEKDYQVLFDRSYSYSYNEVSPPFVPSIVRKVILSYLNQVSEDFNIVFLQRDQLFKCDEQAICFRIDCDDFSTESF